ncbi:MAG TPA: hypothetical protein DCL61_09975, partial [Cyanobacteria bacterium UBA12227]|nr:hypothetical protein [Cyanobacteria bacterium UBA12227]
RLNPEEKALIQQRAASQNLGLSAYLRHQGLNRHTPLRITDVALLTYEELGRIGKKLEQLATATDDPDLLLQLQQLIKQVRLEITGANL